MLTLSPSTAPQRVLCLGAHCDDIEIGCGATLIELADVEAPPAFHWVVFSGSDIREAETRQAASLLLGDSDATLEVERFRDGFFPHQGAAIKEHFEQLKRAIEPDLIFTHYREDRHQDHRVISDLTWNTFRDHLILEYEVPKYDGDLGTPNVFSPITRAAREQKVDALMQAFGSQRQHAWFSPDVFQALMRLRGVECNAPEGHAEAFFGRKIVI